MHNKSLSITALPVFLEAASNLPKNSKVKLMRILSQLSKDYRHPGWVLIFYNVIYRGI
jgi:hypothetical protein